MANQVFTATIASGAATSTALDLGSEAGFRRVYLNNTATAKVALFASADGTTYSPVQVNTTATNAVGYTTHVVASTLSGRWVPLDSSFQYLQVVATGAVANGSSVQFATSF